MKQVSLSEGEWKIMKLLWAESPRTIGQIVEVLDSEMHWSRTTVFIMLQRLGKKGAVRMDDTKGRCQLYYPTIKRSDVTPAETDSFLSRVYDGSIGMMVSALAGRKALTQNDVDELRKVLDEAEKKIKK